jgi:hypothetical protein
MKADGRTGLTAKMCEPQRKRLGSTSTPSESPRGWRIEARCPGEDVRFIGELTSLEDVHRWMNGPRKIA